MERTPMIFVRDGDDSDMGMGMGDMGGDAYDSPLSADGVDFTNATQAANFLEQLLDDTELKVIGNDHAKYFWYGVIVVVAIAAVLRFSRWMILQRRLRDAGRGEKHPTKPKNVFVQAFATMTAVVREISYPQLPPAARSLLSKTPPLGTIILLLGYLAFVLGLEFANSNVAGAQYWQALGVRAGWLAVAQVPLLVLLVNKNNVIGLLTGVSYERLNVLHRWSARIMLLLAVFHFAFQSTGWQKYGLMKLEWDTDECPPTGIAAFALLLWMNITTLAPMRYFSYEFFVIQHILSFFGFIIAVTYHLPTTALESRTYIFVPIGIYLLDRIVRTGRLVWNNARTIRAELIQLPGNATKIRISNQRIKSWRPGQHVLISLPRFGKMQSHPATILSMPRSHGGDLVFILKSHKGFTRSIMQSANESLTALIEREREAEAQIKTHAAVLDGPYGGSHSDFAAFDSVCLIAGSTGVTFTIAILQDLADRATHSGRRLPVRRIQFIWCIRDRSWVSWVSHEITAAYDKLRAANIRLEISIHVTCIPRFIDRDGMSEKGGCRRDKSRGSCCCDAPIDNNAPRVTETSPAEKKAATSTTAPLAASSSNDGTDSALPCAVFHSGRPDTRAVLQTLLEGAEGESAVGVCGNVSMTSEIRNAMVRLSDERAIHKGTGAQGCYLHVENPN